MQLFKTDREKTVNRVILIPVEQIRPNPAQPRARFEDGALQGLSQSISENGILQPLSVRQTGDGYELIAGERRLRAAKLAGLSEVPCILCAATPKESAVYAILENLQRSDLNPIEEATALRQLIVEWNVTQEDAAARLGLAQSTIANKLRILRLSDQAKKIVVEAGLSERHARAMLKLRDETRQTAVARQVAERRMSVAETERLVERVLAAEEKTPAKRRVVVKDVRLFLNTVNKAIATMKQAGIPARAQTRESEDYIEYTVRIPIQTAARGKNSA